MANEQPNQLNLTVVALVALVAIVGLVALVMNAATITNIPQLSTGSEIVSAEETVPVYDDEGNLVGEASMTRRGELVQYATYDDWGWGAGSAKKCGCSGTSDTGNSCTAQKWETRCTSIGCTWTQCN